MTEHIFNSEFDLSRFAIMLRVHISSDYKAYRRARHRYFEIRGGRPEDGNMYIAQAYENLSYYYKGSIRSLIGIAKSFRDALSDEAIYEVKNTFRMLDKRKIAYSKEA